MLYPGPHSVREVHEVTTGLSPFPAPQPPPSHHVHPAPARYTLAVDTRLPPLPHPPRGTGHEVVQARGAPLRH